MNHETMIETLEEMLADERGVLATLREDDAFRNEAAEDEVRRKIEALEAAVVAIGRLQCDNPVSLTRTSRGFLHGQFPDGNGELCSIQESSACCIEGDDRGSYLWLGVDDPYVKTGPPWKDVQLPPDVSIYSRMHLRQSHVRALLPLLIHFAEHGELPEAARAAKEAK